MSTKTQTSSAVTAYLDAVRLYLSDLPEWDVEDLMADIEQHVLEVASEWDGPITSVLGDPITFVEEYRRSANVPPVSQAPTTPPLIDRLVRTIERARRGQTWQSMRSFAREARPGWWALRGYMAASVLLLVVSSSSRTTMVNPFAFGPPGLLISAIGVVLSVHLGRRSQLRSWRRWVAIASNVAVVAGLLIAGQQLNDASYYQFYPEPVVEADAAYEAGFLDARSMVVEPIPEEVFGGVARAAELQEAIDVVQAYLESVRAQNIDG